jgi:hypothetical protein
MTQSTCRTTMKILLAFLSWTILTVYAGAQASNLAVSHKVILRVAQVAILGLDDSSPLELTMVPRALGTAPSASSEGRRLLHYTMVNAEGSTRAITVQWGAQDSTPAGTSLKIAVASVPNLCGRPAPEVTVSGTPQRLITEIPSCETGTDALGAVLRYRLDADRDFRVTGGATKEVVVTFTILDD